MRGSPVVLFLAAVLWLALMPAVCLADASDEPELDMSVPALFVITVDVDELEYDATEQNLIDGETDSQALVATVTTNTNWVLTIYGDSAVWMGPWDKPVGDILWRTAGGVYAPLETSTAQVTSGSPAANHGVSIDVKVSLAITEDLPGSYQYEYIVLEVSAP